MQWPSPWGPGYPGWHIECSAMSKKYLGRVFDIHTGGVDHIPIHHENEIAQSECLEGCKTVNYWMHGEFMLVDGGKMSKSLGNTYTVSQLREKGYDPLDFRYFCLNAHYRKKLNFTFEGMDAAKVSRTRLNEQLAANQVGRAFVPPDVIQKYLDEFFDAVNDDVNVPMALGVLWTMLKEPKCPMIYQAALQMDQVLGLELDRVKFGQQKQTEETVEIPGEVLRLSDERTAAKKNKDYKLADALRAQIAELGFEAVDTADGVKITPKKPQ